MKQRQKKDRVSHYHSPSRKKRILVVEDERPLAHALDLKLSSAGYEVHVALAGLDGLKKAQTGTYDLILLDLILPELDGFSFLRVLREKSVKTPILVLSNLGQEEDQRKARELGIKEYYVKSNTPLAEIVGRVQKLLS